MLDGRVVNNELGLSLTRVYDRGPVAFCSGGSEVCEHTRRLFLNTLDP